MKYTTLIKLNYPINSKRTILGRSILIELNKYVETIHEIWMATLSLNNNISDLLLNTNMLTSSKIERSNIFSREMKHQVNLEQRTSFFHYYVVVFVIERKMSFQKSRFVGAAAGRQGFLLFNMHSRCWQNCR